MKQLADCWTFLSLDQLPLEMSAFFAGKIGVIFKGIVVPGVDELTPEIIERLVVKLIYDPLTLPFYIYLESSLFLIELNPDPELNFIFWYV